MQNTHSFKMNLPEMSDPVDVRELNDNFLVIDDALMAGLCKKELTTNNMGSSDPASRKYGWAPWIEIYNGNEFDVVVIDRNAPDLPSGTINIEAGKTHRMFINGTYYMNFYVQDQHDVTFKWFTNAETRINEIEPSGGGGVSSVNVTGASGSHIESSGGPITDSGTIELSISTGYSIPSDNKQTAWDGKAVDIALSIDSSTYVVTAQLKNADGTLIGTPKTIDLPLETMVVDGEYDSQTQKIKLELKNGNYVEFSVADLVSGLQTELNDTDNKLDPTYIAYDASHRAVSDTEKSTWNAKQNAISDLETIRSGAAAGATAVQPSAMQTALATKQDSLSETQLAAVNSGINSTKVAQIETNKTNILYSLQNGVKNLFNLEADEKWSYSLSSQTVDTKTGTLSIVSNLDWARVGIPITLPAGNYVISGNVTSLVGNALLMGNTEKYDSGTAVFTNIEITTTGAFTANFTLNSATTFWVTLYANYSESTVSNSVTITGMMICTKAAWDQEPNVYRPFALPNYDLTQLEAEDRAALAEVIDDGAKNIIPFPYTNPSPYINAGATFTYDDNGIITVNRSTGTSAAYYKIADIAIDSSYIGKEFYVSLSDLTNMSVHLYIKDANNAVVRDLSFAQSGTFTPLQGEVVITVSLWTTASATFNNVKVQLMICKKALYDISQNYAPYALPNTDLTRLQSEDRNALVKVVDKGAKNLIPAQFVTSTYNGASFVWGENGSFTASRVSEGVYTTYNILKNFELPVGDYVLSIGSALIANYEVRLILSDSSVKILDSTTDTYVDFTITQGLSINYLYVSVGTNATSSVTIYPMICSKADWDISSKYKPYVPYDIRKAVETNSTVNNDLNNCIDTSVVYRCVNSSSLPANCPNFKFNNVSSFEMTCTTPAANVILQELKPNSIATLPRIYYRRRTGVGSEQSPYVWSNWETMNCRYPVISGINYNDCDETGFYEVMGTVTSNTQNSPNGNNTSNNFFVIVQRRDAVYIKQIACDVRTTDVYNRNCINGTWSDWVKLATASDIVSLEARIQALENA